MIRNQRVATEVSHRLLACYNELEMTIPLVAKASSDEELRNYKKAMATVLASLIFDVLDPLYKQHPHLKPARWDEE